MLIGEKLRQRRKERGLSQEQAANLYYGMRPDKPIGRKAISNWENNLSKPNLDDLEILCAIYHCSLPQILDYDFTPPIMHYLEYRRLTDSEKKVITYYRTSKRFWACKIHNIQTVHYEVAVSISETLVSFVAFLPFDNVTS